MKGRGFVLPTREAPEASHAVLGASQRPSSVLLGPPMVRPQGATERCSGFSVMQCEHLYLASRGIPHSLISPTFPWFFAVLEQGAPVTNRGVDPYLLVDACARFGAPDLKYWDPPEQDITRRPPDVVIQMAQRRKMRVSPIFETGGARVERILDALAGELPVMAALPVDQEFEQDAGPLVIGPIKGAPLGNHLLTLGGYGDAGALAINSWPLTWRDRGTATLSRDCLAESLIWCATLEVLQ